MNKRVVVTGLGIVSPVGSKVNAAWDNICNGVSGISTIEHFDTSSFSTTFAGMVSDFQVTDYITEKESRKSDMFVQYGIGAGIQAVTDANLDQDPNVDKDEVAVFIGSGIGGIGTIEHNHNVLNESGPRRVSPFFIPASIVNMTAGHISIKYGFRGPNIAVATACTTGTHSIGLGYRSILYGDSKIAVVGGAEKASTPLGLAGFAAARALSTRNDSPSEASRPWDVDRDGFVLGDGAGVLVLEEYEHAKKRGANIYCELVGFGMSGDAFHITRPSGDGAALSMRRAITDAKINMEQIDYINAHGTSTPAGDVQEALTIKEVLGDVASKKTSVSSTKSMTGHLLGAAGAIEAIFTVLALRDQIAPPTINLDKVEKECDLDFVAKVAKQRSIKYALSNSFGFGGTNGTLAFAKYDNT